mmetsp:Transcript_1749/g.4064  ORF Transcript_1749/g.4064 Transcript_1749/m.4064 type:complete len:333 (+) Transcript_1749:589-1587(+)
MARLWGRHWGSLDIRLRAWRKHGSQSGGRLLRRIGGAGSLCWRRSRRGFHWHGRRDNYRTGLHRRWGLSWRCLDWRHCCSLGRIFFGLSLGLGLQLRFGLELGLRLLDSFCLMLGDALVERIHNGCRRLQGRGNLLVCIGIRFCARLLLQARSTLVEWIRKGARLFRCNLLLLALLGLQAKLLGFLVLCSRILLSSLGLFTLRWCRLFSLLLSLFLLRIGRIRVCLLLFRSCGIPGSTFGPDFCIGGLGFGLTILLFPSRSTSPVASISAASASPSAAAAPGASGAAAASVSSAAAAFARAAAISAAARATAAAFGLAIALSAFAAALGLRP